MTDKLKYKDIKEMDSAMTKKSVKSRNQCKSVIQTFLSYDIVKAHGGELKVESKESEGTQFVINLPVVRITD